MSNNKLSDEWFCSLCGIVFFEGKPDRFASSDEAKEINDRCCDDCWTLLVKTEKNSVETIFRPSMFSGSNS